MLLQRECYTDHKLVSMKLRLKRSPHAKGAKRAMNRRYDVEGLIARTGTRSEETSVKDKYLQAVLEKASRDWHEGANVEDKWSAVRSRLVNAAEEMLGEAGRHQPDWFQESLSSLKPLLEVRNAAYSRWLGSGRQALCVHSHRPAQCGVGGKMHTT